MPREQVEWYVEQSLHDDDDDDHKIHARQCCTYYSIVNVNKTNYPYSSSFEQEQTWTLTRTMSNHSKRYQSSIENIHLTIPCVLNVTTPSRSTTSTSPSEYEIDQIKVARSISLLPPLPPTRQHALPSCFINRPNTDSKISSQQPVIHDSPSAKTNSLTDKIPSLKNSMRIMHINGEFVVRI